MSKQNQQSILDMKEELKIINNVILDSIRERVDDRLKTIFTVEKIDKHIKETLNEEYLQNIILKKIDYLLDDLLTEDLLIEFFNVENKKFKTMFAVLMQKTIQEKECQKLLRDYMVNNFISNLDRICVVEEMYQDALSGLSIKFVPKEKNKQKHKR